MYVLAQRAKRAEEASKRAETVGAKAVELGHATAEKLTVVASGIDGRMTDLLTAIGAEREEAGRKAGFKKGMETAEQAAVDKATAFDAGVSQGESGGPKSGHYPKPDQADPTSR